MENLSAIRTALHEALTACDQIEQSSRASNGLKANIHEVSTAPSPERASDVIDEQRKKVADIANRLLQVTIDPKEYLEQLAASVSPLY